jgi:hypothetical protein
VQNEDSVGDWGKWAAAQAVAHWPPLFVVGSFVLGLVAGNLDAGLGLAILAVPIAAGASIIRSGRRRRARKQDTQARGVLHRDAAEFFEALAILYLRVIKGHRSVLVLMYAANVVLFVFLWFWLSHRWAVGIIVGSVAWVALVSVVARLRAHTGR